MTRALYAFTADPIHYGHLDIITRAVRIFGDLDVAIARNDAKHTLFSLEERLDMVRETTQDIPGIRVDVAEGLLVDYALRRGIEVIVKGARDSTDFDYEQKLFDNGYRQQPGIETLLFITNPEKPAISSTEAKLVLAAGGDITGYVPLSVKRRMEQKMLGQYVIGLTGIPGSGKSYVGARFEELGSELGIDVQNIDLDGLVHDMYRGDNPDYHSLREELATKYGGLVLTEDGSVHRGFLGQAVLGHAAAVEGLNEIIRPYLTARYRQEVRGKTGLILYNAALIAEHDMGAICNNDIVVVGTEPTTINHRIAAQGRDPKRFAALSAAQYDTVSKEDYVRQRIAADGTGHLWSLDNSRTGSDAIEELFTTITKELRIR